MRILKKLLYQVTLLLSFAIILISCSKDTDLLSEYVIADDQSFDGITLLADDTFYMSPGQSIVFMNVLNNDSYNRSANVNIVVTTQPTNGEVTINEDNIITYIPNQEAARDNEEETPVEDTFDYTIETEDENSETSTSEEATVVVTTNEMGELKAFPGAEGYGKYTTGGRGGKVIHVTNLNDNGPGSFRSALMTEGSRTIIFDVGGTIEVKSKISIGTTDNLNYLYENITIAGETAPYPGITITGHDLNIYTSNVIIRYITVRGNGPKGDNMEDAIRIRNWGINGYQMSNIILDHVSMSHGGDENLELFAASKDKFLTNVTIQSCLITKSNHSYAVLVGPHCLNTSFINNFISHTHNRTIFMGYGESNENTEMINNITYGYKNGGEVVFGHKADVIGNIWKTFPGVTTGSPSLTYYQNSFNSPNAKETDGAIYVNNNYQLNNHIQPLYASNVINFRKLNRVNENSYINTWATEIEEIQNTVFTKKVGNSIFPDQIDNDVLEDYYSNEGDFSDPPIPNKIETIRPANYDTDKDGMADVWELARWGTLDNLSTGDDNQNGFTNIEEFLQSIIIENY